MGSELAARPRDAKASTLLVHAAKDAAGANLDRIQVVKCWTRRGMLFEKIYDVAASGGRVPDPVCGALPPVGSTVDVNRATYANDIGATELSAAWTDLDFDPSVPCVYYARILEIPTPRWSTYDAVRHRQPLTTAVPAAVQQRAWTSPVWYTPGEQDRAAAPEPREDIFTVARLGERGILPMGDEEIREVTVGRTVRTVNLVTGQAATLHYSRDGKRTVAGLSDRPLVTPYEIRDGRRIGPPSSVMRSRWRCSPSTAGSWAPATTRPGSSTGRPSAVASLQALLRLTGPVLLGLALLALRDRVKR